MRSKTMTIMAAAVLFLPTIAHAQAALRPFKDVIVGNPDIVDTVQGQTNQELIIITKPEGGTTNIVLSDENGEQVANLLVTTTPGYQPARSDVTGRVQVYRNDDKCYPDCTKPNAPTKRADTAQAKQQGR